VAAGRNVLIRPHPEFREAFRELRARLPFTDLGEPINAQLERASLVLTTGSTVVLEALAAEVPVVVLPEQKGDLYKAAGIVAVTMKAPEILDIASRQARPERREELNRFLEAASGSRRADRMSRAADAIEAALARRGANA
jgi:UDP:flavonoid glycosyltransferase YjiC (YdhE family)